MDHDRDRPGSLVEGPTDEREDAAAPEPRTSEIPRLDRETLAPAFFAVLFLGSLFGLGYILSSYVGDIVLAFVLVGMFGRTYEALRKRLGNRAAIAAGLTTLLALVLIVAPLLTLLWLLVAEAPSAYAHVSDLLGTVNAARVDDALGRLRDLGLPISRGQLVGGVELVSSALRTALVDRASGVVGDALALVVHLATMLVVVFYILMDGARLRSWVYQLSPLPDDEDAALEQTFKKVFRGVIYGNGLGSVLQGVLGGLAMWAAGFQSAVLWGAVMSVLAFLPLVGIAIVTVPATVVLLVQGKVASAVAFFAFVTVQALFVENVVKTRLMGSAMRMHDLLVFLSVLGGIGVFGLIGVLYGPLIAMLFVTLSELYFRRYRPLLARRLARGRHSRPPEAQP